MRDAMIAAIRRDPDLFPKVTETLRARIDRADGPLSTMVEAAEALEPILHDVAQKRPSKLSRLGFKSAHLLAGLALDDSGSSKRLAHLGRGGHVGIVFVDIDDFTRFTAEHGDEAAIELLAWLDPVVEGALKPSKGECVKKLGDGYLLAFPSASQAVRGAVTLRDRAKRARERDGRLGEPLQIAVHAGEPLIEQDDLLGHDVNVTARLLDHCAPDEVVVSEAAKRLAERRLKKITFSDPRIVKIRGLTIPVPIYTADPISEDGDEAPAASVRAGST